MSVSLLGTAAYWRATAHLSPSAFQGELNGRLAVLVPQGPQGSSSVCLWMHGSGPIDDLAKLCCICGQMLAC